MAREKESAGEARACCRRLGPQLLLPLGVQPRRGLQRDPVVVVSVLQLALQTLARPV